jgi:hypothetical protein
MARTFIRQDTQIRSSDVYSDAIAPTEAVFETNPVNIEDNLNHLRSQVHNLMKVQGGNWWDAMGVPATFTSEGEVARGTDLLNTDLHELERKRVLRCVWSLASIATGAGDAVVILGAGELPGNLTAALGAVTSLGTVVAAHGATFGNHSLALVAGSTAISPKNLVNIVEAATRDPILSAGRTVYALLHAESGIADGTTITDTTTTRVQLSFVRLNAGGTALEIVPFADIESQNVDYCYVERVGLDDLNEQDFLGGANIDVPAGANINRQASYDNQGTTPVDLTNNAVLDLEGAGLSWTIRDDLEASLFSIVEGSAGGTSQFNIHSDVDEFDVDAIVNNFAAGATLASGLAAPIEVGVTSGLLRTTAGDLQIRGTGELILDDGNLIAEGTWAGPGVKLTDTATEITDYEAAFGGEVSLFNAIVQAYNNSARVAKTYANVSSTTLADVDVGGTAGGANLDAQLPDMSGGNFLTDYDVFLNGELLRPGADASANNDYYPGTSLVLGQLKFEFVVKTGDVIVVIAYS